MIINGITWNGLHSQLNFGATMLERDTNVPERDRIIDRVPYSNITYDFTALYGSASYPERTLIYKFAISDEHGIKYLKQRIQALKRWLYNSNLEKMALYDDREQDYHFNAVCTGFSEKYTNGVLAEVTVTFMADPYMIPNAVADDFAIPESDSRFPDLDGDGSITSVDATMILTAATNIGAGYPSGLTEEQEFLADADRDRKITAMDATLVQNFAVQIGTGKWHNTPKGWVAFLNYQLKKKPTDVL